MIQILTKREYSWIILLKKIVFFSQIKQEKITPDRVILIKAFSDRFFWDYYWATVPELVPFFGGRGFLSRRFWRACLISCRADCISCRAFLISPLASCFCCCISPFFAFISSTVGSFIPFDSRNVRIVFASSALSVSERFCIAVSRAFVSIQRTFFGGRGVMLPEASRGGRFIVPVPSWGGRIGLFFWPVHVGVRSQGRTHVLLVVSHEYPADPIHPWVSRSHPTIVPVPATSAKARAGRNIAILESISFFIRKNNKK